ncbi:MAG TPA: PDZ domain-containing protein [Fimbriimonadaceae bacterium]|jgi:hypothetical protein
MLILSALAVMALSAQDTFEVPFKMGENAIIVDATVNNHPLSLLFDSGFAGSVVADDNINLGEPDGTINLRDFVGQFQAKTVKIKSLKLGSVPIQVAEPEAVEQPAAHLTEAYDTHTDGILGFQAIENYVTEINFQTNKFIFHPKSYDITQKTPDNKKTFLVKMLPLGANSVELSVLTDQGKKMILALDTGNAFYATTHRDVLERVGLWDASKDPKFLSQSMVASGPVATWEKKLQGLTIFGVPVPTSYWDVIDLPSSDADGDGTVGIQFLRNFNIMVDYDRRRVWLENFSGEVANEPEGSVGIFADPDKARGIVSIEHVAPGSPAEKAGIARGDHLLEIAGTEVSPNWTLRQLATKLKGKPGSDIEVAVSHDGSLARYTLKRMALFNE